MKISTLVRHIQSGHRNLDRRTKILPFEYGTLKNVPIFKLVVKGSKFKKKFEGHVILLTGNIFSMLNNKLYLY